jgi:hypothetical protein
MNRTSFPTLSFPIATYAAEKPASLCLIKPTYSSNGINPLEMDPFIASIEQVLYKILPENILDALIGQRHHAQTEKKISELKQLLPILFINSPKSTPCTLSVAVLCPSEFTGGVGRYLSDTFSRWLVPGKFLNISCAQSLNFSFIAHPVQKFFFHQIYLDIHHQEDLSIIHNNWEALKTEIRLNILSVKHARHVIAVKKLSSEQKKAIIQENIASVLDRPLKDIDHNAFDQMQQFLLQLTAEEKLKQVKEQFLPSFEQRPKAFQRDIFNELKHFVLLFGEKFTASHTSRYVSKLISYQYLFRKTLKRISISMPGKRHLSVKLMKTQLNFSLYNTSKPVLGIFGAMSVLRENEVFEEKHLFQAVRHCLGHVRKVENSFILDRRSHDPIRVFYIEIEKKEGTPFEAEEIRKLQKNLPREIKESVESVVHPVFMPRNEEEIMRNMLLLSQQLKYVSDLPQVIISFDAQGEQELVFRVILLRILKDKAPSIRDYCSTSSDLTIRDLEIKHVGMLRKKHIKEANVFKVSLNKKRFLRKDFSIDLFKARQALSSELNKLFKGIRDFNGGILSKQQEAFVALRNLVKDTDAYKDFLLENFFYSLTPPLHQSLILPSVLKALFMLNLEAFEADYKSSPIFFKAQTVEDQLLIVLASPSKQLKDSLFSIVNTLQIPSSDLSFAQLSSYEIHSFGYIYQSRCAVQRSAFHAAIYNYFKDNPRKF